MTRLFYAVPEVYPPWRLDVEELFSNQLPKHGIDVVWSMRRNTAGKFEKVSFHSQEAYLPLRISLRGRIGLAVNKILQYISELYLFYILLFGKKYNIIQVRDRRYFFVLLGWLVSRMRGSKFVYWLSYPFPEHVLESAENRRGLARFSRLLRGRISWWYVYRFAMQVADQVFVQSDQMRDDVVSYGVSEHKLTPVPMGVPDALMEWVGSNKQIEIVPGKVVYIGTFAKVRRLSLIIDAFALVKHQMPKAILYMVGAGDYPSDRKELEELATQRGIGGSVRFTGFVPMTEAWLHAASAAVCVSPIAPTQVLNAGSPTKLVEYMALARPIVANDHPEQSRILAESDSGLCVSWDANAFATAIIELLSNSKMASEKAIKGPGWVARHRTYEKISTLVSDRYVSLLKERL